MKRPRKRPRLRRAEELKKVTKEQVVHILQEILQSQRQMKVLMKELIKELRGGPKKLSFKETYEKVKAVQPEDPLDKNNLSMMDFNTLLDKFRNDPTVKTAIMQIMGTPIASSVHSEKVKAINVKDIINVHKFMLEEMKQLVSHIHSVKDNSYDMKTATIAAQALVGAKVEENFDMSLEDIEEVVFMHHTVLATDQEFLHINAQMSWAPTSHRGT